MHIEIEKAKAGVSAARLELDVVIDRVRSECLHVFVVETPFDAGTGYFGYFEAMRICPDCGYEEEASHWPGYLKSYSFNGSRRLTKCKGMPRTQLNSQYVRRVSRDDFYRLRP